MKRASFTNFIIEHKNEIRVIFFFVLFGLVTLIPWYLNSLYYIFFIVLSCIVILAFRKKYMMLLVIPIFIITVFFTRVPDTFSKIKESNLEFIQNPQETFRNIFTAGMGREALPTQVQEMLSLISRNSITSYQLSVQFTEDSEIYQRIIESAWPIKLDNKSPYFLVAAQDKNDFLSHCTIIDQREDVFLAKCN